MKKSNAFRIRMIAAAVILILAALCLSGCGRSAHEKQTARELEELGLDREEAKEAAALLEEWDEELRAEEAEAQNEAEAAAPVEYERFDASPDWAQYSVDDQAVQIDDTVYVPGVPLKELVARVESSSVEYGYEYNPSRLVTPNESCFLSFYRDGEEWFTVEVRNLFTDTTALSELPVFSIEESESAHTYCRFLNGTSPDELLSLSYDEAKHFALLEHDFEMSEQTTFYQGTEVIAIFYNGSTQWLRRGEWTGFRISNYPSYTFYVDANTSKVVGFFRGHGFIYQWVRLAPEAISTFSQLSDDELGRLLDEAVDYARSAYGCADAEAAGYCFQSDGAYPFADKEVELYNLCVVVRLNRPDGSSSYVDCEIERVCRERTGRISCDTGFYLGGEENSVEDVLYAHNLFDRISDTTFE